MKVFRKTKLESDSHSYKKPPPQKNRIKPVIGICQKNCNQRISGGIRDKQMGEMEQCQALNPAVLREDPAPLTLDRMMNASGSRT